MHPVLQLIIAIVPYAAVDGSHTFVDVIPVDTCEVVGVVKRGNRRDITSGIGSSPGQAGTFPIDEPPSADQAPINSVIGHDVSEAIQTAGRSRVLLRSRPILSR